MDDALLAADFQRVRAGAAALGWGTVVADCDRALAYLAPPSTGSERVPVIGNSKMHQQQNWMADWIAADIAHTPRAVPWTLGADLANGVLARPLKGREPKRTQAWHLYGIPTELYSCVPWFDPQGRSHPYNPETSDDLSVQRADFARRPPPNGPRGENILISQCTVLPHVSVFPPFDASLPKTPNTGAIPRHPLALWLRHDAYLMKSYADGRVVAAGFIPGIRNCYDACFDGRRFTDVPKRKLLYVCDVGDKDAAGNWKGGRIVVVDRTLGSEALGGDPQEDASKYTVQTICAAGFPTAVRSAEDGTLYFIDGDKGGEITRVRPGAAPEAFVLVAGAFAMDYANGKLVVACIDGRVHIVDAATGVVGPDVMPFSDPANHQLGARNVEFFTVSIDANGTCGPVGRFMVSRVHGHGNCNSWRFEPNVEALLLASRAANDAWRAAGSPMPANGVIPPTYKAKQDADGAYAASVRYGNAIHGSGHGWNVCGDAANVHELFGHYDWLGGKYHIDQAVQFVGGYANCPVGVLVHDPEIAPGVPAPLQASVDYTAIWRGIANICTGGTLTANLARPSLTCLMSREGWSPFKGCSNDELAELPFDDLEDFIHRGYVGAFRRDDIQGADLWCLMLHHVVNSQRHIREGKACVDALTAWWKGKGRTLPGSSVVDPAKMGRPLVTTHVDGNNIDVRLEVRETAPGAYRIGVFANSSADIAYGNGGAGNEVTNAKDANGKLLYPMPSDAVIVVDQGTEHEQVGTATLAPGWHAFTVRSTGYATGAVTYKV